MDTYGYMLPLLVYSQENWQALKELVNIIRVFLFSTVQLEDIDTLVALMNYLVHDKNCLV